MLEPHNEESCDILFIGDITFGKILPRAGADYPGSKLHKNLLLIVGQVTKIIGVKRTFQLIPVNVIKEILTLIRICPRREPGDLDNGSIFARGNDLKLAGDGNSP